jgi:DNA-binding NtrC family response regulator
MILVIDDDIAVRTSLQLLLEGEGYTVGLTGSPGEALAAVERQEPELILLDLNFSLATSGEEGMQLLRDIRKRSSVVPVILITGWATIQLAVRGMKLGASDFLHKPWDNDHLLQSVKTLLELRGDRGMRRGFELAGGQPARHTRRELDELYAFGSLVGEDEKLLALLDTVGRVAGTDAPVLITGESGTGKELVAEALHQNSMRRQKAFVKVNLGGVPAALFESELFGHVRGAFTDARTDRVGRFELAHKGTIFLDEIGELDGGSQVKLLRVLQDRTYEVLGSSRTRTVDVRVVCATNRNLEEEVARGNFREDLLYRINLIRLHLPALRDRAADIPLLVDHFIGNLRAIYNRPELCVTPGAMRWLQQLPLPGNIRQLKNIVERSVLVSRQDRLDVGDLQSQLEASPRRLGSLVLPGVGTMTLEEIEIQMIRKAMAYHHNKVGQAAVSLGLTRSSLYRRLEKYNIPYEESGD